MNLSNKVYQHRLNLPTINQSLTVYFLWLKRIESNEVNVSASNNLDISYGIYTIERLPKGSKRAPKWDLHSIAKDKETAESHARTLSVQPYYNYIEVQEFRTCPHTKSRSVHKIKHFSRSYAQKWIAIGCGILSILIIVMLFL